MRVDRIVYTIEVEITFTDDEMKSEEDVRGFLDYCTKEGSKESWIRESVHDGNYVIVGTRVEQLKGE